jgi:hypothetical protein
MLCEPVYGRKGWELPKTNLTDKHNDTPDRKTVKDGFAPKKQFLPLMNTDGTDKERSNFVGRYKHKAVGFGQCYQCNQW